MKKLYVFSITILLMLFVGIVGFCADENFCVQFWGDSFESYDFGQTPYAYPDFYNSSAQKRPHDWTDVSEGITVGADTFDASNKVACIKAASSVQSYTLSKYTDVDPLGGDRDFEISFKVKPGNGNIGVSLTQYGGYGGTSAIFEIKSGNAWYGNNFISDVDGSEWISVRINIILSQLKREIYIGDKLAYACVGGSEEAMGYIVRFVSTPALHEEIMWDDFAFSEISESHELPVAQTLSQYAGVHPRVFYSAQDFELMRSKAAGAFKDDFEYYIKKADELCRRGALEYWYDEELEELWMRNEGDNIRFLSLMYKLTGNPLYKSTATSMVDVAIGYPSWGRGKTFENKDLACSHMLIGISCYYDWLYHDLTADEKTAALNIITERASLLNAGGWWSKSYLMNHLWINASACMTSAMSIYDEVPDALNWARSANKRYNYVFHYLTDDGANHEGLMYWQYGQRFMNYYLELASKFYGKNYYEHSYLQNTARYAHCMMNPDSFTSVRFSDYNDEFDVTYIGTLSCLNSFCTDDEQKKINQWFINKYYNMLTPETRVDEILLRYYSKDEAVISPQDAGYSTETYFSELGLMFSRSSWADEDQSYIAFRCGPVLGEKCRVGISGYDPGSDHVHNDINSPQIYSRGENILAEDIYGGGLTAAHNTLLVNNKGQIGDNGFLDSAPDSFNANPHIVKQIVADNIFYAAADATAAYDAETTGLKKFVRHFIYAKPNILIIVDDIETSASESPIPIELRFFPMSQTGVVNSDGSYAFMGRNLSYEITPVTKYTEAKSELITINKEERKGVFSKRNVIRIASENSSMTIPTIISWTDSGNSPKKVSVEFIDGLYYFCIDDEIIVFDSESMSVEIKSITVRDLSISVSNDKAKAVSHVSNETFDDAVVYLIAAAYDENNELCDISFERCVIKSGVKNFPLEVRDILRSDKHFKYRAFIWNEGMEPLFASDEYIIPTT